MTADIFSKYFIEDTSVDTTATDIQSLNAQILELQKLVLSNEAAV